MAGKGKPFGAGNPGNTAGRRRGSRNATTLALEALLDGEAVTLTRMAVDWLRLATPSRYAYFSPSCKATGSIVVLCLVSHGLTAQEWAKRFVTDY